MKFAAWSVSLTLLMFAIGTLRAEDTPLIDPVKVSQLQRLEPLTGDKVDVFVESGQLTKAQADWVKKHIGPNGQLALPASSIAAEARPAQPVAGLRADVAPPAPAAAAAEGGKRRGVYADFDYRLKPSDRERLERLIADYRHGNRPSIGRELRQFRPQVNALIVQAYTDPIDLPIKIALWEEVAGPANPDAAIGLFETHRAAYDLARPVLIAYDKDAGGIIVRRLSRHPDAKEHPAQRWMTSRELREDILEIEGLIARCSSVSAAIFLMDVYSQRYDKGEAPMRDKGRDRHRLVEACGGNPKKFDEDESDTWGSRLSQHERAIIAEQLIPWLHKENGDRRKIAKNGLQICLPRGHPDWDDGAGTWQRWWDANKDRLLNER
ncbi:MAG TPA: hypothetical protein VEJ63_17775 [Planctomycetota bacterium]|nr:hypothetical protein [Planctomycetota bacterium]